jgi:outer membrane protein assembly factor BamB
MKTIAFALLILLYSIASAQEATKWRGPAGSGIYPDVGLLKQWPPKGPEMLWHFDGLGEGYSSPVFANGRIYINGMINHTGFLFVLSESGTLIDKFEYGEEYFESYPGARSSVTIAGDIAYVMTGKGRLVCMNTRDGKIVWEKHMFRDFGGRNIRWGITETVVVDGNTVYCTPGGGRYNVVALNRSTGNIIWTSEGKRNLSAYCTPLLVKLPSRKVLVTHTADNIICLDASDGTLLWSQGHTNTYSVHPNTPIYHNGSVYCFSGYGQGGIMIEMDDRGNKKRIRWRDKTLDSKMGGAVLVDGFIYGSGDNNRTWKSLNWETGDQGYNSSLVGPGAVIFADGNLYCYSQRGELAMVPVNPSVFRITGKIRVELGTGPHWAHPVINNGRLFVRHGNSLMAYKIK